MGQNPNPDPKQPQPVRKAFLWFSAVVTLVIAVFPVLQMFEVIQWSGDQIAAVTAFLGLATTTIAGTIASIYSENRVTPVESPRDNSLTPLVPVANDGFND
jgi:hypothetical protein